MAASYDYDKSYDKARVQQKLQKKRREVQVKVMRAREGAYLYYLYDMRHETPVIMSGGMPELWTSLAHARASLRSKLRTMNSNKRYRISGKSKGRDVLSNPRDWVIIEWYCKSVSLRLTDVEDFVSYPIEGDGHVDNEKSLFDRLRCK